MALSQDHSVSDVVAKRLADGAADLSPVLGSIHSFYRYPARFSPKFAAAAINALSRPGDMVLDPYMGGGTTVVEALRSGRRAIGNDLNSLAVFVTRVKTTRLQPGEIVSVERWRDVAVPTLGYRASNVNIASLLIDRRLKNMDLPRAKFIKKAIAGALATLDELPTPSAQSFLRCAILRTAQWALDGRETHTSVAEFRAKLVSCISEMLAISAAFWQEPHAAALRTTQACSLYQGDAAELDAKMALATPGAKADLVVTSPPYPGVHVLYHRWQVDGRRETPAPYWIAACNDGQGASFYNFGDRRQSAADDYFRNSLLTLNSIRRVVKDGGYMVQMIAFNLPEEQLPRYLTNMKTAGFAEVSLGQQARIRRRVPHRKWHAAQQVKNDSANEVVLVHRAV